jgi:hypothetical protein
MRKTIALSQASEIGQLFDRLQVQQEKFASTCNHYIAKAPSAAEIAKRFNRHRQKMGESKFLDTLKFLVESNRFGSFFEPLMKLERYCSESEKRR